MKLVVPVDPEVFMVRDRVRSGKTLQEYIVRGYS